MDRHVLPAGQSDSRDRFGAAKPAADRLVGRADELAVLADALHRLREGHGCVLLLTGPPGVGKTRLAEEATDIARSIGCATALGRCSEDPGAPPFLCWTDIAQRVTASTGFQPDTSSMSAALRTLIQGGPEGEEPAPLTRAEASPTADSDRFLLFDTFSRFLARAAHCRPLLVVVDDLGFATDSARRLFLHVSRETSEAPLMLLATLRDTTTELVASLARVRGSSCLPVSGLDSGPTRELLECVTGREIDGDIAAIAHRLTEGNPLLLRQMSFSVPRSPRDRVTAALFQGSLRNVIGARLGRARATTRLLVEACAALGPEFSSAAARRMLPGADPTDVSAMLDEAAAAQVLERTPGRTDRHRFVHALVRDSILAGIDEPRRIELHARAVGALEDLYRDDLAIHASEILPHCAAAAPLRGAGPVRRYALMVGEHAASARAYEEALAAFETGFRAREGELLDDEAAALFFGMARMHALLSAGYDALPYFVRCFEHYERAGNWSQAIRVLSYPAIPGEPALIPLFERALTMTTPGSIEEARLLLMCHALKTGFGETCTFDDALLERILEAARLAKDGELEMRALRIHATITWYAARADTGRQLAHMRRARDLARGSNDVFAELEAGAGVVTGLMALGRTEEATREAQELCARADRCEDRLARGIAAGALLGVAIHDGRWKEAFACLERMEESQKPTLDQMGSLHATRATLHCETGDEDGAARELETLARQVRATPAVPAIIFINFALAAARFAWVTGDERFLEEAAAAARLSLGMAQNAPMKKTLARVALATIAVLRSDQEEAEQLLRALGVAMETLPEAERPLQPWTFERGLLARAVGRLDEAVDHFEAAMQRPGADVADKAWSQHELAVALDMRGGTSDVQRAAELRGEALRTAERVGLKPLAKRLRARGSTLPDGLSSREVEVLGLIARGLTNREIGQRLFISTKTVDAHVRNLLEKTGMANRTEAAAWALRQGLAE